MGIEKRNVSQSLHMKFCFASCVVIALLLFVSTISARVILNSSLQVAFLRMSAVLGPDFTYEHDLPNKDDSHDSVTFLIQLLDGDDKYEFVPGIKPHLAYNMVISNENSHSYINTAHLLTEDEVLKRHYIISNQIQLLNSTINEYAKTLLLPSIPLKDADDVTILTRQARICAYFPRNYEIIDTIHTNILFSEDQHSILIQKIRQPDCSEAFTYIPTNLKCKFDDNCISYGEPYHARKQTLIYGFKPYCILPTHEAGPCSTVSTSHIYSTLSKSGFSSTHIDSTCSRIDVSNLQINTAQTLEETIKPVFGLDHQVKLYINGAEITELEDTKKYTAQDLIDIIDRFRTIYDHPELDMEVIEGNDVGIVETITNLKTHLKYDSFQNLIQPSSLSNSLNLKSHNNVFKSRTIDTPHSNLNIDQSSRTFYETLFDMYSLYSQLLPKWQQLIVQDSQNEYQAQINHLRTISSKLLTLMRNHIPANTETIFISKNIELSPLQGSALEAAYNDKLDRSLQGFAFGSLQCVVNKGLGIWKGKVEIHIPEKAELTIKTPFSRKNYCILEGTEQAEHFGRRIIPGPDVSAISTTFQPYFSKSLFNIPEAAIIKLDGEATFACLDGYIPARDIIPTENRIYCTNNGDSANGAQIDGNIDFLCVPDLPTCTLDEFLFDIANNPADDAKQANLHRQFVNRLYYEGEYLETLETSSIWYDFNNRKSKFIHNYTDGYINGVQYYIPPQCRRQQGSHNGATTNVRWFINHGYGYTSTRQRELYIRSSGNTAFDDQFGRLLDGQAGMVSPYAQQTDAELDHSFKKENLPHMRYGYRPIRLFTMKGNFATSLIHLPMNDELITVNDTDAEICQEFPSSFEESSFMCGAIRLENTKGKGGYRVLLCSDRVELRFSNMQSMKQGYDTLLANATPFQVCPQHQILNPVLFPFSLDPLPSNATEDEIKRNTLQYKMTCFPHSSRWEVAVKNPSFNSQLDDDNNIYIAYAHIRPSSTPVCVDKYFAMKDFDASKNTDIDGNRLKASPSLLLQQLLEAEINLKQITKEMVGYSSLSTSIQVQQSLKGHIFEVMRDLTKEKLSSNADISYYSYSSLLRLKILKNEIALHPRTFKISHTIALTPEIMNQVSKGDLYSKSTNEFISKLPDEENLFQYYSGPYSQVGVVNDDMVNSIRINVPSFLRFYPTEKYDVLENSYRFDLTQIKLRHGKSFCSLETLYPHHIPLEERLKWTDIRYTYDTTIFSKDVPIYGLPVGGFMTIQPRMFSNTETPDYHNYLQYRLHSNGEDNIASKISLVCLANGQLTLSPTRIPYAKRYPYLIVSSSESNNYNDNSLMDIGLRYKSEGCIGNKDIGPDVQGIDSSIQRIKVRNTYYRSLAAQGEDIGENTIESQFIDVYCLSFLKEIGDGTGNKIYFLPYSTSIPLSSIRCKYPNFLTQTGKITSSDVKIEPSTPLDINHYKTDGILGEGNFDISTSFGYDRAIHGDGAMLRCTVDGWSIISSGFRRLVSPIILHNRIDTMSSYYLEYTIDSKLGMPRELYEDSSLPIYDINLYTGNSKHSSVYIYDILTVIPKQSITIPLTSNNNISFFISEIDPTTQKRVLTHFSPFNLSIMSQKAPTPTRLSIRPSFTFIPIELATAVNYQLSIITSFYTSFTGNPNHPIRFQLLSQQNIIPFKDLSLIGSPIHPYPSTDVSNYIVKVTEMYIGAKNSIDIDSTKPIPYVQLVLNHDVETKYLLPLGNILLRYNFILTDVRRNGNFDNSINLGNARHKVHQEQHIRSYLHDESIHIAATYSCTVGQLDRPNITKLHVDSPATRYARFTMFSSGYVSQTDSSYVVAMLYEMNVNADEQLVYERDFSSSSINQAYIHTRIEKRDNVCSSKHGFMPTLAYSYQLSQFEKQTKHAYPTCLLPFSQRDGGGLKLYSSLWLEMNVDSVVISQTPLRIEDKYSLKQIGSTSICQQIYSSIEFGMAYVEPSLIDSSEYADPMDTNFPSTYTRLPKIHLYLSSLKTLSNKTNFLLSRFSFSATAYSVDPVSSQFVSDITTLFHTAAAFSTNVTPQTVRSTFSLSFVYDDKTLQHSPGIFNEYLGLVEIIKYDNTHMYDVTIPKTLLETYTAKPFLICPIYLPFHYTLRSTYYKMQSFYVPKPAQIQFSDDFQCNESYGFTKLDTAPQYCNFDPEGKPKPIIIMPCGKIAASTFSTSMLPDEPILYDSTFYLSNNAALTPNSAYEIFYNENIFKKIETDVIEMELKGGTRRHVAYIPDMITSTNVRKLQTRLSPGTYFSLYQSNYFTSIIASQAISPTFSLDIIDDIIETNKIRDGPHYTTIRPYKICQKTAEIVMPGIDHQLKSNDRCDVGTLYNLALMTYISKDSSMSQLGKEPLNFTDGRSSITSELVLSVDIESLVYAQTYSHPTSRVILEQYIYKIYDEIIQHKNEIEGYDQYGQEISHSTQIKSLQTVYLLLSSDLPKSMNPREAFSPNVESIIDWEAYEKYSDDKLETEGFGTLYDNNIFQSNLSRDICEKQIKSMNISPYVQQSSVGQLSILNKMNENLLIVRDDIAICNPVSRGSYINIRFIIQSIANPILYKYVKSSDPFIFGLARYINPEYKLLGELNFMMIARSETPPKIILPSADTYEILDIEYMILSGTLNVKLHIIDPNLFDVPEMHFSIHESGTVIGVQIGYFPIHLQPTVDIIDTFPKPLLSTKSMHSVDLPTTTTVALLDLIPRTTMKLCMDDECKESSSQEINLYETLSFQSLQRQFRPDGSSRDYSLANQSSGLFEKDSISQLPNIGAEKFLQPLKLDWYVSITTDSTLHSSGLLGDELYKEIFVIGEEIFCDGVETPTMEYLENISQRIDDYCHLHLRITPNTIRKMKLGNLTGFVISVDLREKLRTTGELDKTILATQVNINLKTSDRNFDSLILSVYDPIVIEDIIKNTIKPNLPKITSTTLYLVKTEPNSIQITNQPFSFIDINDTYLLSLQDQYNMANSPQYKGSSLESNKPGMSQVFIISDKSTMKITMKITAPSLLTTTATMKLQFIDSSVSSEAGLFEKAFNWRQGTIIPSQASNSPLNNNIACNNISTESNKTNQYICDFIITPTGQDISYQNTLEGTLIASVDFFFNGQVIDKKWEMITLVIPPRPKQAIRLFDVGFSKLHEMDDEHQLVDITKDVYEHKHTLKENIDSNNVEWNQLRLDIAITDTASLKLKDYSSAKINVAGGVPLFITTEDGSTSSSSIVSHSATSLYISDEETHFDPADPSLAIHQVIPTNYRSMINLGLNKSLTNIFFVKQNLSHSVQVQDSKVEYIPMTSVLHFHPCKRTVLYIYTITLTGNTAISQYILDPSLMSPDMFTAADLNQEIIKDVLDSRHNFCRHDKIAQDYIDATHMITQSQSIQHKQYEQRVKFKQLGQLGQLEKLKKLSSLNSSSNVLPSDVSTEASIPSLLLHAWDSIRIASILYESFVKTYPIDPNTIKNEMSLQRKIELQKYEDNIFLLLQSIISSTQQIDLTHDYIIARYGSILDASIDPSNRYILLRLRECVFDLDSLTTTMLSNIHIDHTVSRFEQYHHEEMNRLQEEYTKTVENQSYLTKYVNSQQNMAIYSSKRSTFVSTIKLWIARYYETLRSKQRVESVQLLSSTLLSITNVLTVNDDIPYNIIERSIRVVDSAATIIDLLSKNIEDESDGSESSDGGGGGEDKDTVDDLVKETRSLLHTTETMMNSISSVLFYDLTNQNDNDKNDSSDSGDGGDSGDSGDGGKEDDEDPNNPNNPSNPDTDPVERIITTVLNTEYPTKQIETETFVTTFVQLPMTLKSSQLSHKDKDADNPLIKPLNLSFTIKRVLKNQNQLQSQQNALEEDKQPKQQTLQVQIPSEILTEVTSKESAIIYYSIFKSEKLSKYAIEGKEQKTAENKNLKQQKSIQSSKLFNESPTSTDYSSIIAATPIVTNIVNLSILAGSTGDIISPSISDQNLWYFIEIPTTIPDNEEINPGSSCIYIQTMSELLLDNTTNDATFKEDNSCQFHTSTSTSIICRCTHLTYFSSRFSSQAFVPRFQRITIDDIRSISWDNLTRNPTPIIILIVWPIVTIIFVFIGSRIDRRLYRQGFAKLLQDWDPSTHKPYTKIDVYRITKPTSLLNHIWRRYLYTIRDSHLWLSVFYRQTTHNYSSQSRALAVMIVLLSSFTLSGLLFGYTSQGFIIVTVITSVCVAAINEIFRFLYDRTDQDKLKRYVYYYAESLIYFYFTGKSNLFPIEMHEKLMQDRPAVFSDAQSAHLEELVLSLGWESIPIWHIIDHKNRDVPRKYEGTVFDKNIVKKYASTAANVDNFYYRPRDYETTLNEAEARHLHSRVRHKLPKECLDVEVINTLFFKRPTNELIPSNARTLVVIFMLAWIAACYFLVLTNATVLATSGATSATLSLTRDWVTSAGTSLLLNIFVISFAFGFLKNIFFYFGKLWMLKCIARHFKGRAYPNSTTLNNSKDIAKEIMDYKYQQSSHTSKKLVAMANNTTESLYTQAMPSIRTFRRLSIVSGMDDIEMVDVKHSSKLKHCATDDKPTQLDTRVISAREGRHSTDDQEDDSLGDNTHVFSVQQEQHKANPEELYEYIRKGSKLPSTHDSTQASSHVFFMSQDQDQARITQDQTQISQHQG